MSIFWKRVINQICGTIDKNPLNNPIAINGQMLKCGFIRTFVIADFNILQDKRNVLSYSLLLHQKSLISYDHFRTLQYIVSTGLDY